MIHKIEPHKYDPVYRNQSPKEGDYLLLFDDDTVYLPKNRENQLIVPTFSQVHRLIGGRHSMARLFLDAEYLFSIDRTAFFRKSVDDGPLAVHGREDFHTPNVFRSFRPGYLAFAGITACQINRFRLDRRYCGRCGALCEPSDTERAMVCPECGQIEYPKISPAIITAVIDKNRILLTRYAGGTYRSWALVAGFVEVGETFKGAVRREIMEEVGLKVKNITYYKSQPWAFSDSAMIGFFAELDGDNAISLQEEELSTARWFEREEIPELPSDLSIGQEMIRFFRDGGNPFIPDPSSPDKAPSPEDDCAYL